MTTLPLETELTRLGTRLKTLRAERTWTLEDLASRTDLSPPYLCRLETGERQPSLAALISLAQAFELPLAALFGPASRSNVTVTRAGGAPRKTGNDLEYVPLTGGTVSHLNAVLLTVPARRANTDLNHHDSEELVYVLAGRVCLIVGDESFTLEPGDSAHYDARAPHRCDALDDRDAQVLLVASTAPKTEFEIDR
jgi:quercetin dioxygenase-like cupin family protein/DNA-binding XRE family transcriptional regulator